VKRKKLSRRWVIRRLLKMTMYLGDALKLLGEDGLTLMIQLVIITYETGEWSKDFITFIMIAPNKKQRATKIQ
jgi:hypothetical protein